MHARKLLACVTVAATATLSGCASLPTNSAPHVIRSFNPVETETQAAGPEKDQAPDLLLRDFYAASARPDATTRRRAPTSPMARRRPGTPAGRSSWWTASA